MITSSQAAALFGAALLLVGAGVGGAEAMPVAPLQPAVATAGVEQAAYLHRRYPGYYSRSARAFRHARRLSPNRYCRSQPSRCR